MNVIKDPTGYFSLSDANRMLPLINSIVTEIVQLSQQIEHTRHRLAEVGRIRISPADPKDIYRSEVISIEDHLKEQENRIAECKQELINLNLDAANVEAGYVDFPAARLGSPVRLCWRVGEQEVCHWHFPHQNCEERQLADLELIRQSGDHASL